MKRAVSTAVLLLAASLVVPGCPAQRRTLSREALLRSLEAPGNGRSDAPPPTLAELQALRVPAPAPVTDALAARADEVKNSPERGSALERARLAIAVSGDVARAEAAWALAPTLPAQERADLLAHRCVVEEALRRYPEMIEACAGFLDVAPEDGRAAAVALVLARARPATLAIDQRLMERHGPWTEGCRAQGGSCADLAWVLARAVADATARSRDETGAKAAFLSSGALTKARVEGPFADAERFAFGFEGKPFELRSIPGRTHERERSSSDGRFAPALRGDSGLYRLTFDVEGGGDATLFVTGRHALRVLVDDAVVLERRPLLREEPGVSRAGVRLAAGAHRVVVIAHSYGAGDGLSVSALDAKGRPALRPRGSEAPRLAGAERAAPVPGAREALHATATADDLAALDAHLLGWGLGRSGFGVAPARHRDDVRTLLATWGFAPQALVAAATAVGDDETVPARFANADAAPLWDRLEQVWPSHPVALITRARALRDERPDDALAAYRELVDKHPAYAFGRRERIGLALERGLVDEALTGAEALLAGERSPENVDASLPALRRTGRLSLAAALERERARAGDGLYSDSWARWLLAAGRTDEAVAELRRVADASEGHPAEELLVGLLSLARPEEALERTERLVEAYPNDAVAARRRVELLARVRGPEAALEAARTALGRFGADGDLHAVFEELGGEPLWRPRLAAGDEAVATRRARAEEPFPGHPIVMLVDHLERHLMPDLSSVEVRHWIAELKSEDALDGFGELHVSPRQRLLRLRVIKPDGRVFEPEHPPGVEDVSLTGLGLGDIVEMLTVSYDDRPPTGGLAFETFRFSSRAPATERSYVLSVPKALLDDGAFRIVRRGAAPEPRRTVTGDGARTELTFTARDVPASFDEPHAPPEEEHGDLVGYAYADDMEHWALLRGRDMARGARSEPWLEEAARRIAGEGSLKERFARLFSFVVSRVEPASGPREATSVLATGRGDRAPLLLALARAAGLEADPVAVHVPVAAPLEVPTARAFSAVGVRAALPDGPSFAFVDGQLAVLDQLPPLARGAAVLDLALDDEPQERLATLPESAVSAVGVKVQVDLEWREPDHLEGFVALTVPSYLAEPVRRGLRQASSAQLKALFEEALGESFPGVRVDDVRVPHLEASGEPLGVGVTLEVPVRAGGVEPVRFERLFGQGASGPLGLFTPLSSYLRVAERAQPLLVVAAAEELELELTLPAGAAFVEAPERYEATAGPFTLTQRAAVTDGTLFWTRKLSAETARVAPTEWQALRAALTSLSGRTEARVAFVVP